MNSEFDLVFKNLSFLFNEHGFHIYLVGGAVRDILLGREPLDFDFATDAKPNEIKNFLQSYDDIFEKYGVIQYKVNNKKYDIVSFRKEKSYSDSRHPGKITFIRNIKLDSKRRDFTINAMYMDINGKIFDFYHSRNDIKNKIIRMVGNPNKRIKEDPLRIIRAVRFALTLDFSLDKRLVRTIKKNGCLLTKLSREKIKEDVRKIKNVDRNKLNNMLIELNIFNYLQEVIQ